MKTDTRIYRFGHINDVCENPVETLGAKAANLAELSRDLGVLHSEGSLVRVPSGYTLPTSLCVPCNANRADFEIELRKLVREGDKYLKSVYGYLPLVSVRSAARVSMPGMMDTILNVGISEHNLQDWAGRIGLRSALDCRRRFLQMYGSVVEEIPPSIFENALSKACKKAGVTSEQQLSAEQLTAVVADYEKLLIGADLAVPTDRVDAIVQAVMAVFFSWENDRAKQYRKQNDIPYEWGTSATVQAMVFGNMNDSSCSGVLFTRDKGTGEKKYTGDFIINGQGEEVVAGIRDTLPIADLVEWDSSVSSHLFACADHLEGKAKDALDIEFTVQDGEVFILQWRKAQRTARAAVKIAHDLAVEGIITKEQACGRVSMTQLLDSMSARIDPSFSVEPDFLGVPAGGPPVSGVARLTSESAANCTEPCILVRRETDPDDYAGIVASVGILTGTGGTTCHAAVVASGLNRTAVVGATCLQFFGGHVKFPSGTILEGTKITIDGETGKVWVGEDVPLIPGGLSDEASTLCAWALESDPSLYLRLSFDEGVDPEGIKEEIEGTTVSQICIDLALVQCKSPGLKEAVHAVKCIGESVAVNDHIKSVIVDSTPFFFSAPRIDIAYFNLFGISLAQLNEHVEREHAEAIEAIKSWPKAALSKLYTRTEDIPGTRRLRIVHTFADLLEADGLFEIPPDSVGKIFGNKEALAKAVSMVAKATGKALMPARAGYWYDLLGYSK